MAMIVRDGKQGVHATNRTSGYTVAQAPAAHAHSFDLPIILAGEGITLTEDDASGTVTIAAAQNNELNFIGLKTLVSEAIADMRKDIEALIERVDELAGLS